MLRTIEIKQSVFADNNREADSLRAELKGKGLFLLNLMSSPGSGKTTIGALVAKRLQIGSKIGALKAAAGTAIRDETREAEVLRSRGDMAPEYRTAVEAVFRAIMAQTRQVEQE